MDAQNNEPKTEQKKSIFRQKALDRISSPEELDQYLKVTGPGVWLPLLTVIVLLIGSVFWMVLGQVDITVDVAVSASGSSVVCYVPAEQKAAALARGTVTVAGKTYALTDIGLAELPVDETLDRRISRAGKLPDGSAVAPLAVDAELTEGIYTGQITMESVNPIKYIIN